MGLQELKATSSGTSLHDFRTGNVPVKGALFYIHQALALDLLSAQERRIAEALDETNDDLITRAYLIANDKLLSLAKHQKAQALEELGFNPRKLKSHCDQTQAQVNVAALWCMTEKHVTDVQRIYGADAPVMLLDEQGDIVDPYCLGVPVYKDTIKHIWSAVQKRIRVW